jgi:Putative zinc-finger
MSFVLRARPVVHSRHLDAMLSAYADRTLPAAKLLACDQHVSICPGCRGAVDAERRLLSSLRTAATPDLPSRLESALLGLGVQAAPAVLASTPSRLVVVGRSAPAMHRSPVRAAMLASLAAGASAVAAWSVGVSGVGPSPASQAFLHPSAPAATAPASGVRGPSSQPVSLLSTQGTTSGSAGTIGLTTFFVATAAVPVASPRPGVPQGTALGTIEP